MGKANRLLGNNGLRESSESRGSIRNSGSPSTFETTPGSNTSKLITSDAFLKQNNTIITGPMALGPTQTKALVSNVLNLDNGSPGSVHRRIVVNVTPETGTTDDLENIDGAVGENEIIILVGTAGNTITIKHNFGGNGLILCPGNVDYTLASDEMVILIQTDNTSSAKIWRVLGTNTAAGSLTSPLTTKGDIWGYDTGDARIPIGTDGNVLIADSTQTLGVRWGTASGAGDNLGNHTMTQILDNASFSHSNYVGWTAAVGQTMDVGASGNTWNLPTNDAYLFRVNGADQLQVSETTLDVFNNSFAQYVGWTAGVGQTSAVDNTGITNDLPAADSYTFRVNGADQFEILENQINLHSHSFTNFVGYTAAVGQGLTVDGTGNIYDLPAGDQYNFRIAGSSEFVVADGASAFNGPLSMNTNKITSVVDPTNAQDAATKAYVDLVGGGGGVSFPIEPTVTNVTSPSDPYTLDLHDGDGHVWKFTTSGDINFSSSVNDKPPNLTQLTFELEFVYSGSGTHTVTLPSNFTDEDGATLTSFDISSGRVILSCRINDGTNFIVLQKNVAAVSGGNFATIALDNLVSPVLNTGINFDSNSPTNFPGFTTGVGQALVIDGVGMTFSLPTNDLYDFKINGTSQFNISSLGVAVDQSIQLNDTSSNPTTNGEIQRNGTDILAFTGGSVVNLSDIGGATNVITQGNSNVTVTDAGTGAVSFTVDAVSQGSLTNAIGWSIDNDVFINSLHTLTVDGDTFLKGSETSIQNTNAPILSIYRNETTATTGIIGELQFKTEDSGLTKTTFFEIETYADVITNGSEDSEVRFIALNDGSPQRFLEYDDGGLIILDANSENLGFFGNTGQSQQLLTGARDDPEGALLNLINILTNHGLITDSTTAS